MKDVYRPPTYKLPSHESHVSATERLRTQMDELISHYGRLDVALVNIAAMYEMFEDRHDKPIAELLEVATRLRESHE